MAFRPNIDQFNIVLMLVSCAAAYFLPFEVLLFSYAFLGPAHYLTQISWMHDRHYFTGHKWVWLPACLMVGLLMLVWDKGAEILAGESVQSASYIIYIITFAAAAGIALTQNWQRQVLFGSLLLAALLAIKDLAPAIAQPLVLMIPTVVHIYIFTGAFILLGALRSSNVWGLISLAVFIGCGAFFLSAHPYPMTILPEFSMNNIVIFDGAAAYLTQLLSFNGTVDGVSVLSFLGFAYTYHYLNWFSKAEVIKWANIPRKRLAIIALIYVASIGIYLYDYKIGFSVLLFLSVLHVFLEFPLNALTFRSIGTLLWQKITAAPLNQESGIYLEPIFSQSARGL